MNREHARQIREGIMVARQYGSVDQQLWLVSQYRTRGQLLAVRAFIRTQDKH